MIEIILPPFLTMLLILFTHIPLGKEVLKKGIIFIDLAIAQAAALGYIISQLIHIHNHFFTQIIASLTAILVAIFFSYIEKKYPTKQEAIIGLSYVFIASITSLILSYNHGSSIHLQEILSGELLFISWEKLFLHLPIYVIILFLFFFYKERFRRGIGFYFLFSLAVTSSVQLVGIFMVFISLISPALILENFKLKTQYFISFISIIIGLLLSIQLDSPSSIVCILSLVIIPLIIKIVSQNNK